MYYKPPRKEIIMETEIDKSKTLNRQCKEGINSFCRKNCCINDPELCEVLKKIDSIDCFAHNKEELIKLRELLINMSNTNTRNLKLLQACSISTKISGLVEICAPTLFSIIAIINGLIQSIDASSLCLSGGFIVSSFVAMKVRVRNIIYENEIKRQKENINNKNELVKTASKRINYRYFGGQL